MRTIEHGEHLVQLRSLGFVNAWLVREADGFTLVDTGMAGAARGILRAAERNGAPIRRILLTHAHADHAGSLDALVQALPDVEVGVTARDARFLAGDRAMAPGEGRLRGTWVTADAQPTLLLEQGMRVGSLEVHAAPGHTPGMVAFLDTRDRTLIAGDSYVTFLGTRVPSHVAPQFPLPWIGTCDRHGALDTAVELRRLAPTRLAVGHGRLLRDPAKRMDAALKLARAAAGSHV